MAQAEQASTDKKGIGGLIHVIVAAVVVILFWNLPAVAPITPLGMKVAGIFIAMVYLWSTVGSLWPSVAALVLFGIAGTGGDAGFAGVFQTALGNSNVVLIMLAMILFGALDEVGCTKYIARWILTRKALAGRPIVLIALVVLTAFFMSPLVGSVPALLMMWPIAMRIVEVAGIEREDRIWKFFFMAVFLGVALGQPFLPFKGSALVGISAFEAAAGTKVPYLPYMTTCLIAAIILFVGYFAYLKIARVDTSKLKVITPEVIEVEMPLPPMNFQQKVFMWMLVVFMVAVLLPSVITGNPVCDFLNSIGALGVTAICLIVMVVIQWNGKPLLQIKKVCANQFQWGVYFMVAAGVYGAGLLANKTMGIRGWIVQNLNPLLGDKPEFLFILTLIAIGIIITTFAHNGAMAVVLMPIVLAFSTQLNIDPIPVAIMTVLAVHVAMLTPAASVPSAVVWGRTDLYSPKDILSIGLPFTVFAIVAYSFIAYPLAKAICAAIGA